jgi:hypothetical protein
MMLVLPQANVRNYYMQFTEGPNDGPPGGMDPHQPDMMHLRNNMQPRDMPPRMGMGPPGMGPPGGMRPPFMGGPGMGPPRGEPKQQQQQQQQQQCNSGIQTARQVFLPAGHSLQPRSACWSWQWSCSRHHSLHCNRTSLATYGSFLAVLICVCFDGVFALQPAYPAAACCCCLLPGPPGMGPMGGPMGGPGMGGPHGPFGPPGALLLLLLAAQGGMAACCAVDE